MRKVILAVLVLAMLVPGLAHAAPKYATYHINWLMLTPTKVYTTDNLGKYSTPDAGNKFLIVMFHVVNKDDVPQQIAGRDFKARLSNGQIVDASYTTPTPDLNSTLDVGVSYDGGLNFKIPVGVHSAAITWAPSPGISDVKWPSYTWRFAF
jgi:hypothetical protein